MNSLRDILPPHLQPRESDILQNFRPDNTSVYYWLALLAFMKFMDSVIEPYKYFFLEKIELKARGILNAMVYEKAITVSQDKKFRRGKILNFLNMDIPFVCSHLARVDMFWNPFLIFFSSLYFLIDMIGYSTFIGLIGPVFVAIPLFVVIGAVILLLRNRLLRLTDQRIHTMSDSFHRLQEMNDEADVEELKNISVNEVITTRNKEVFTLRTTSFVVQLFMSLFRTVPIFIIVTVIISHYLMEGEISLTDLYASFGLFMNLSRIVVVPIILIVYVIHYPSFARIDELLDSSSSSSNSIDFEDDNTDVETTTSILLENATFEKSIPTEEQKTEKKKEISESLCKKIKNFCSNNSKHPEEEKEFFRLTNLNLEVHCGDMVVVTGPRRCGKSTLLESLLGATTRISGRVVVNSDTVNGISYLPQVPYILSGTIIENIVFFSDSQSQSDSKEEEFDEDLFRRVVSVCGLGEFVRRVGTDVNIGDSLGSISVADKFRISFARAIYSKNRVILIDDPLFESNGDSTSEKPTDPDPTIRKEEEDGSIIGIDYDEVREMLVRCRTDVSLNPDCYGLTVVLCVGSDRVEMVRAMRPIATVVVSLDEGRIRSVEEIDVNLNTTESTGVDGSDKFSLFSESDSLDSEEEGEGEGDSSSSSMTSSMSSDSELVGTGESTSQSQSQEELEFEELEGGEELESELSDSDSDSSTDGSISTSTSLSEEEDTEDESGENHQGDGLDLCLEERPVGRVPMRVILSFFRPMFPCHNLILTFLALLVLFTVDTAFRTGTQWYLTNMSSRQYFHRQYGTSFRTSYLENFTLQNDEYILTNTEYYGSENVLESCPESGEGYKVVCEYRDVNIFWNSQYRNETVVKDGLTYGRSLVFFCVLTLLNTLISLFRVFLTTNLFLNSSNFFFQNIVRGLYQKVWSFKKTEKKPKSKSKRKKTETNKSEKSDIDIDEKDKDLEYFQKQPVGRLISRMAKDISTVDQGIGRSFDQVFMTVITGVFSVAVMTLTTKGFALIPILFVAPLYVLLFLIYHKTPRELKRLESIARSRVFVSLDTAIMGREVIKAYGKVKHLTIHHCKKYVNVENRIGFLTNGGKVLFWVFADIMGSLLFILITLSSIYLVYNYGVDHVFLLLAIHYSNSVAMFLGDFVYTLTALEAELNALERVYYYYEKLGG